MRYGVIGGFGCKASWWWLRSPGNNTNNAANVNTDGTLNVNGNNNVNNTSGGVRPALPQPPFARNLALSRAGLCYGAKEPNPILPETAGKHMPSEIGTREYRFPVLRRRAYRLRRSALNTGAGLCLDTRICAVFIIFIWRI